MTSTRGWKRFFQQLIIDAVIFLICSIFFLLGRAAHSTAREPVDAPVPLPVIMYHSVCGRTPSEYAVTPDRLEADLRWLSENGYTTVTAQQVIEHTRGRGTLPEKSVMLTLDDGFYNNLSVLLPLLERYDMKAVISVVGSYADNEAVKDPHNDRYSYLTWDDMRELADSGRVEFGNHTYSMHSLYDGRTGCRQKDGETEEEYRQAFRNDIARMQESFRLHLGIEPVVFAYPFGGMSRASLPVIREQGFLMTLTCREQVNLITRDSDCLYGIGRFNRSGLYSTEYFMGRIFGE